MQPDILGDIRASAGTTMDSVLSCGEQAKPTLAYRTHCLCGCYGDASGLVSCFSSISSSCVVVIIRDCAAVVVFALRVSSFLIVVPVAFFSRE